MSQIINIINEEIGSINIFERQDIEKVELINELISQFKTKLENKQYYIKKSWKDEKYVASSVDGVNIYLSDVIPQDEIDGFFSYRTHETFNPPFIVLFNSKFMENKIEFDENALAHELQHYLDYQYGRYKQGEEILNKPFLLQNNPNPKYWTNSKEWNAYLIQNLREYFQKVELKQLSEDFKIFIKDFFEKTEADNYYKNINDEYKRKFMKRVYQFHQKILEKKQSFSTQTMFPR